MGMFKKKKVATPPPETEKEKVEITTEKEPEEMTLEQVLAQNSEAWYKAQILNQLAEINETLKKMLDENTK